MSIEAWVYFYDLATVTLDSQMIAAKRGSSSSFELRQYAYSGQDRFIFYWRDSGGTNYNARTSTVEITPSLSNANWSVCNGTNI